MSIFQRIDPIHIVALIIVAILFSITAIIIVAMVTNSRLGQEIVDKLYNLMINLIYIFVGYVLSWLIQKYSRK